MDLIGLVTDITNSVLNIDSGRKGFAIRGKEQEGRISYEDGIEDAWCLSPKSLCNDCWYFLCSGRSRSCKGHPGCAYWELEEFYLAETQRRRGKKDFEQGSAP